jgi:hypothetical protein
MIFARCYPQLLLHLKAYLLKIHQSPDFSLSGGYEKIFESNPYDRILNTKIFFTDRRDSVSVRKSISMH